MKKNFISRGLQSNKYDSHEANFQPVCGCRLICDVNALGEVYAHVIILHDSNFRIRVHIYA